MSTKRLRPSGSWEFVVRRKGILPKPLSLTFETEAEGDAYVARLEQMLDAGILPDDLVASRDELVSIDDAIRAFMKADTIPPSDKALLYALMDRWKAEPLRSVNYQWAELWIRSMKRRDNLSPSTIRHYVGALARCFDWVVRSGNPFLAVNVLRLLPKRYATYTEGDCAAVRAQDKAPKEDRFRDRRMSAEEEAAVRVILAKAKPEGRQRPLALTYRPALIFLFDLALESAMRMREIYTLGRTQMDIGRRTVFLDKTKNGHKRQVPMTSVALRSYETYLESVRSGDPEMGGFDFEGGRLFPWWDGTQDQLQLQRTTAQLSRQYARIFAAACCVEFTFHDLRHEATSRLYEKTNLSDIQIAKITGHSDPKVLMRYANIRGSDLASRLW
jgi:integrase